MRTEVLLLRRATCHSCRLLGMTVVCGRSSSHRVTAVLVPEQRCDVSSLGATVHVRRSTSEESNQLVQILSRSQSRPIPARRLPTCTNTAVTQNIAVPLLTVRQSDIGTCFSGPRLPEDRRLLHVQHPALPALYEPAVFKQCGHVTGTEGRCQGSTGTDKAALSCTRHHATVRRRVDSKQH